MYNEECFVEVCDKAAFTGNYEECKEYIVRRFTPAEYDDMFDYIHILGSNGRSKSFVLEW